MINIYFLLISPPNKNNLPELPPFYHNLVIKSILE